MNITLTAVGDLQSYFGREPASIDLPDGATIRDLLNRIEERWGERLPPYMWNREQAQFKGPVLLVIGGKAVRDPARPLEDGTQIKVMNSLAGG